MSKGKEPTTLELLLASNWSEFTIEQIAQAIGRRPKTVKETPQKYKAKTGKEIPHAKPKTVIDRILEMDCTNLSAREIATALDVSITVVYKALKKYREETGKDIPHNVDSRGRGITKPTTLDNLLADDWSDLPPSEIAWTLGVERVTVVNVMREYKKRTGKEISHAPEPRRRADDE